jgi:hypothetical protein
MGRYILAFVESTGNVSPVFERKTREIFAQNGLEIEDIEEDSWHQALNYAEAMTEIRDEVGEKTLQQAGVEQAMNVPWPEEINSVSDGLEFLVEADKQAHNNEIEGNYDFELTGENVGRVSIFEWCPYPVDNFKGVFEGGVKSLSDGSNVTIDDVDTRADEKAAFRISW